MREALKETYDATRGLKGTDVQRANIARIRIRQALRRTSEGLEDAGAAVAGAEPADRSDVQRSTAARAGTRGLALEGRKLVPGTVPAEPATKEISTRNPTGVNATENHLTERLHIGLDALKKDQPAFEHNVQMMTRYGDYKPIASASTTHQIAERIINHLTDNLVWLHDQVPAAIRERSMRWYNGTNRLTKSVGHAYGIKGEAAEHSSGHVARLSA